MAQGLRIVGVVQSTSLQKKLIVVTAQSAIRVKSYVVDEIECAIRAPLLALILVLLRYGWPTPT